MANLNESLSLVGKLRAENGGLADLTDDEVASAVFEQTGDERLRPAMQSGRLSRGVAKVGQTFSDMGQSVQSALADQDDSLLQRSVARASGDLVASLPEMGFSMLAGGAKGLPRLLGYGGGSAFSYGRTKAETGDDTAALGSAAGFATGTVGGQLGGQLARKALGPKAGALKKFAAGTAGGAAGSLPGDVIEVGTAPGGFEEFLKEDTAIPSYMLGSIGFGAAMDLAGTVGEMRREKKEAIRAAVPNLEDIVSQSEAAELQNLRAKPISQRTDLDEARMKELTKRFNEVEERRANVSRVIPDTKPAFPTMPETEATLTEQMYLFKKGKKPVVEVQKGSPYPDTFLIPGYHSYTSPINGNDYLYDERQVKPEQIDAAIQADSIGELLGLGSPRPPKNPTGQMAVLRGPSGVEKVAVVLGDGNESQVMTALEKMALGNDKVTMEPMEQVMKWRAANSGLKKAYSIAGKRDPQDEIKFSNRVLDMFNQSLTKTEQRGARFQPDPQGMISSKGLLKAVKQWAPPEIWEYYREKGIEKFLTDEEEPLMMYTVYGKEQFPKQIVQIDPLINEGRGEPLTDEQRAAQVQPPEDLPTGQYLLVNNEWVKLPRNAEYEAIKKQYGKPVGKVSPQKFATWLRENTPEVQVKKLVPRMTRLMDQQVFDAAHRLETQGFRVEAGRVYEPGAYGGREITDITRPEYRDYGNETLGMIDRVLRYRNENKLDSDAATGRYGIEPKPIAEMPGAVDILVRVPTTGTPPSRITEGFLDIRSDEDQAAYNRKLRESNTLYRGPHFGDSDVNVLASVRGYEETLPSGEKVFHVFEVQSDWGQDRDRIMQELAEIESAYTVKQNDDNTYSVYAGKFLESGRKFATYEAAKRSRDNIVRIEQKPLTEGRRAKATHPLLAHYETLALKTAIQHAREIGAKYIAISDAETAMMTEGHDRYGVDAESDGRPVQEPGMRAAYDQRLPAIAARLTRSKPSRVDFGQHEKAFPSNFEQGNAVIGSPVYNGKSNITARLYDITNPSPEVSRLFSLYDLEKQVTFETELDKQSALPGEQRSQQELLKRAINGDRSTDLAALSNFLDRIKGIKGLIREVSFGDYDPVAGRGTLGEYDFASGDIKLSKDALVQVKDVYSKLSHEMTHGALAEMRSTHPEVYQQLIETVEALGPEVKRGILNELKKVYKLGDFFDVDYLAGESDVYDKADPTYVERKGHEFVAGLMEGIAHAHFDSVSSPKWMSYLPAPVVRALRYVTKNLARWFGDGSPSLGKMLTPELAKKLNRVTSVMQDHLVTADQANLNAILGLAKSDAFDESSFVQKLPTFDRDMALTGKATSLFGDIAKKFDVGVNNAFRKWGFSGLFRTRTNPETADFFWSNHAMRPNIQTEQTGYHARLGQTPDRDLSQNQALERWARFKESLENPFNKRRTKVLDSYSRAFEENQNRRQVLMDQNQVVRAEDLVKNDELVKDYGLTEEEAEFFQKIRELPEIVMKEKLRKVEQADTNRVSKLLLRLNRKQDYRQVVSKVDRLQRIANDFGARQYEYNVYSKALDREQRSPNPNPEYVKIYSDALARLEPELAAYRQIFDQNFRIEFNGQIPFNPDGPDSLIDTITETMVNMAATRAQTRFATKDAGYAPMTRRGRFLLRVYEDSPMGPEFAKVREFRGFEDEKAARDYIEKNKLTHFELIDKETLEGRVRMSNPDQLKRVRDEAKAALGRTISRVASRTATNMDPVQRESLLKSLKEIEDSYRPLEDEIKEVVSVMGDKFAERRHMVKGFDRNDFLPNIFEYMNFQTVAGHKLLTRTFGELQLERDEIASQPELRQRMEQELDYVLNNQNEFNLARKGVFYYYLGASIRHVIQNAVQIPMNGVSQLMAEGHGLSSYVHFAKAAKLAAQYGITGSTGDKQLDILLKQAEKDGVSFQTSIESPAHDSVELQNALDTIDSQNKGTRIFGEKVPYLVTKGLKGFEKFLQSTSAAAEAANRKTTFIASVLAQRAQKVTDPAKLYGDASKFTNYVNFVGDKANRPGYLIKLNKNYMHGPVSLASALQSFTINHISQLYSFWEKGFKQGSKADKQAFITGMAHLLAFAGANGFIGVTLAQELFEEMFGMDVKGAIRRGLIQDLELSDRVADSVMHGLPALAGIDLSSSVGLGSPFLRYQAGQPLTLEQVGGAAIGAAGRVIEGVRAGAREITEDPFDPVQWFQALDKGLRAGAPTFLSQAQRAFDVVGKSTVMDTKGQPLTDPLDTAESVAAMAGLNPMTVSKQRAANTAIYKSQKKAADSYERATLNVAKLLHLFEQTGNPEWMEKAQTVFDRYVADTEGTQDRGSFVSSIATQLQNFREPTQEAPSLKQMASRRQIHEAYPSAIDRPPSRVSSLLGELEVAQSLGQDDLLLQKLNSLPSSVLEGLITDLLGEAGLSPAVTDLIQSPSSLARLGPDFDIQAVLPR
jgi:hypothetical protein